jgi:SSS family solute:Na+ symporter
MGFQLIDYAILVAYIVIIVGVGLWVTRRKKGAGERDAADYFIASKSLSWWVIGASLIASNISAEQFIAMSGSGFALGMGIASYEFMAAATLIVVAVFFLPIFLRSGIYTMPQFLEQRYDGRVKRVMAIFWLVVFVFVNLSSILYLGALTVKNVLFEGQNVLIGGVMVDPLWIGIIGLGLLAASFAIGGGLKAVAVTDVVQVFFLIGGGLITSYVALKAFGGTSALDGFIKLTKEAPEHFDMVLTKGKTLIPDGNGGVKDAYMDLPGLSVLLGGMWVANLYYWGCNQFIIQRALAAKSIGEAQKGLVFAGFLKLLLPLIVVIPGIVAFAMKADIGKSDEAYPWLLYNIVPTGIKGLAFAALVAAIVGAVAGMLNSISTIFTMDIYQPYVDKNASQSKLVKVGRISAAVALLVAFPIAITLQHLDQAFQFIQEFTGFVSPGALAIFLLGFFWKRATANGALLAAIGTFLFSLLLKWFAPMLPFMDRMGIVFLLCVAVMIVCAFVERKGSDKGAIEISPELFKTSAGFKVSALIIAVFLVAIYTLWW